MNKTQAGRLLTLAYFLKKQVPEEQFDLRTFLSCKNWSLANVQAIAQAFIDGAPKCGTTACALGWATHVFPYKFRITQFGAFAVDGVVFGSCVPAVCDFFGITVPDWEYLFGGGNRRSARQEAKVIEQLVKKQGWTYAD